MEPGAVACYPPPNDLGSMLLNCVDTEVRSHLRAPVECAVLETSLTRHSNN